MPPEYSFYSDVALESNMGPGAETARRSLGLTDEDMNRIHEDSRRRRIVTTIVGGVGTIAAMIAGYATAHSIYYERYVDPGTYPYMAPLAALGLARGRSWRPIVGIAASMTAAFVLMFAITAAGYSKDPPPAIMYSVWHRD